MVKCFQNSKKRDEVVHLTVYPKGVITYRSFIHGWIVDLDSRLTFNARVIVDANCNSLVSLWNWCKKTENQTIN